MAVCELPAVIANVLADIGANEPVRRHWDADFGKLWLIPTRSGILTSAEIFNETPPDILEWAATISGGGKEYIVRVPCEHIDHAATQASLYEFKKRMTRSKGGDHAQVEAAFTLMNAREKLFGPHAGAIGWKPKYIPPAAVKFDLSTSLRARYVRLLRKFSEFLDEATSLIEGEFKDYSVDTVPVLRVEFQGVSLAEPDIVAVDCLCFVDDREYAVTFLIREDGAPEVWSVAQI